MLKICASSQHINNCQTRRGYAGGARHFGFNAFGPRYPSLSVRTTPVWVSIHHEYGRSTLQSESWGLRHPIQVACWATQVIANK